MVPKLLSQEPFQPSLASAPLTMLLPDALATQRAGFCLGAALLDSQFPPIVITLRGELGAGKTTFCQGFGQALGVASGEIKSPTFSLAHEHQGKIAFSHLDLYRLENNPQAQFLEAGLDEYLAQTCLVEWPERLPDSFWPLTRLDLAFTVTGAERILTGRGVEPWTRKLWLQTTQLYY
jgi:tRNA threonylcarbamoyladenosine biosynthesis protein TsaE